MKKLFYTGTLLAFLTLSVSGCVVGAVIDTASDVVIETAKIPFKVGGAVVDVVSGDDD